MNTQLCKSTCIHSMEFGVPYLFARWWPEVTRCIARYRRSSTRNRSAGTRTSRFQTRATAAIPYRAQLAARTMATNALHRDGDAALDVAVIPAVGGVRSPIQRERPPLPGSSRVTLHHGTLCNAATTVRLQQRIPWVRQGTSGTRPDAAGVEFPCMHARERALSARVRARYSGLGRSRSRAHACSHSCMQP